jgi:Uma2 family endonuclease
MLRKPLAAKDEPVPYRFSVKDWHRLGESGLFEPRDRVELLDGEIIIMSPIGGRHAWCVTFLTELFVEQNRRRYFLWPGNPVEADTYSEPLPDLTLVPRTQKNAKRHPRTREALLIVEVADSSLAHDRNRKLHKYAQAGVREYWIVNLKQDVVEIYRSPKGQDYLHQSIAKAGDDVAPQAFPDLKLPVNDIIPRR